MRPRKSKVFPIALSVASISTALGCSPAKVKQAVDDGTLETYCATGQRRIVLVEDIIAWVRTWPKPNRSNHHAA